MKVKYEAIVYEVDFECDIRNSNYAVSRWIKTKVQFQDKLIKSFLTCCFFLLEVDKKYWLMLRIK